MSGLLKNPFFKRRQASANAAATIKREPGTRGPPAPPRRGAYSEFAGRGGVDATRYGDWEYGGRCTDF